MPVNDLGLLFEGFLTGLAAWFIWRVTHPWHCACGYRTWRMHAFIHHIEIRHQHKHLTEK